MGFSQSFTYCRWLKGWILWISVLIYSQILLSLLPSDFVSTLHSASHWRQPPLHTNRKSRWSNDTMIHARDMQDVGSVGHPAFKVSSEAGSSPLWQAFHTCSQPVDTEDLACDPQSCFMKIQNIIKLEQLPLDWTSPVCRVPTWELTGIISSDSPTLLPSHFLDKEREAQRG